MRRALVASVLVLASVAGCGGGSGVAGIVSPLPVRLASHRGIHRIKHVIVIMQENRSFDSYFGTYPGRGRHPDDATAASPSACPTRARAAARGRTTTRPGERRRAARRRLRDADIDGGRMDGFVRTSGRHRGGARLRRHGARGCAPRAPPDVMGYHDAREIPNYWR